MTPSVARPAVEPAVTRLITRIITALALVLLIALGATLDTHRAAESSASAPAAVAAGDTRADAAPAAVAAHPGAALTVGAAACLLAVCGALAVIAIRGLSARATRPLLLPGGRPPAILTAAAAQPMRPPSLHQLSLSRT